MNPLEQVQAARAKFVRMHMDGDLDRDDLDVILSELDMEPFGHSFTRRVTLTFTVGAEREQDLDDISLDPEVWFDNYNEDTSANEPVIVDPSDFALTTGPIQRGNLPS